MQPSIVIDAMGGVDLQIVSKAPGGGPWDIRLARWPDLGSLRSGATPVVFRIAGPFESKPDFMVGPAGAGNDYQMVTASGCYVWCGYARSGTGAGNVYVRRIGLCPAVDTADINRDSIVDASDMSAFLAGFCVGAPLADINHDGVVDTRDAAAFTASLGASLR
jgi:hypothetical protein